MEFSYNEIIMTRTKTNQAEQAYQNLRRMLLEHRFEAGSRLMEPVCCELLKVNRGDVRLALTRLYAEGLLFKREKRGFSVPKLSHQQVEELYEARLILETGSAHLSVRRAAEDDLSELEAICADMERMARGGYPMGVSEADLRFHEVLVRAAHNAQLTKIYQSANLPLTFVNPVRAKRDETVLREDARQHRMILKALKRKDAKSMISLLQAGMDKAKQTYAIETKGSL
jgi:DNA-binding GntR family transcriptional regulator